MLITLEKEIEEGKIYMVDLVFLDKEGKKLRELKSQVYKSGNERVKRWAKSARLTTGNRGEIKAEVFEIRITPIRTISSNI